jgi:hypothetical protein
VCEGLLIEREVACEGSQWIALRIVRLASEKRVDGGHLVHVGRWLEVGRVIVLVSVVCHGLLVRVDHGVGIVEVLVEETAKLMLFTSVEERYVRYGRRIIIQEI